MKYALMLPEYNVKKAEKELQDFKDNKINLLTNKEARKNKVEKVAKGMGEVVKEAIVYTAGSLVKNTIKSTSVAVPNLPIQDTCFVWC